MKQHSLFPDLVPDRTPRTRKPQAQQMSMFADGDLFNSRQTRTEVPGNPRLFDLVLAYPDETEEEARQREARERNINLL